LFLAVVAGLVVRLEVIQRDVELWETYQKESRSRGEDLGIDAWLPPAVAEAENFAAHPWIAALIASELSPEAQVGREWADWQVDELNDYEGRNEGKSWFESHPDKAAAVMERGASLAADFKAIREAAGRSGCRLPSSMDRDADQLSAALRPLGDTTEMLSIHAEAALAMDQEAIAVEDIETLLRMGDHLQTQHFLLAMLAGKRAKASALSLIEVGLASERFSPASRLRLRSALVVPPTAEDAVTTMRLERGMVLEKTGKLLGRRATSERFLEGFLQPPARRAARFRYSFCKVLDGVLQKPPTRVTWEAFDSLVEEAAKDLPSRELAVGSVSIYRGIFPLFFEHADRIERIRQQLAE
jgi:hypothetical protein